jgi:hypothetical protein
VKRTIVLALCMGVLPLAAQTYEVGLFLGQQRYKSADISDNQGYAFHGDVDDKTVYGVRVGYSLVDLGPALLQVTAAYQPESTSTMNVKSEDMKEGPESAAVDYKHSSYAVGAMFNFKALVAVGVGLDYRFEKLDNGFKSTTYSRPWMRANAGMAFPTPVIKPFVGLEVAVPLMSKSLDGNSDLGDLLKCIAPKLQVGVYGGVRF